MISLNIAAVGCIHNDIESLLTFIDRLSTLSCDVIVCPGDFTDSLLPRGFTRIDIGTLILEELRSLGKPVFVVPGSWDKDLIEFFNKENVSIHGSGKMYRNLGFFGYGGARTPFNLPFEPSDDELLRGITTSYKDVENAEIKVLVTHAPPLNTKLDIIPSGAHVGSAVVRKFIESHQPQIAICAHIHESKGSDVVGNTHIVNCGRFPEGYCGLINIEKDKITTEVVSLI